jgi:DNA-binding beta-propeller fold protein YncE
VQIVFERLDGWPRLPNPSSLAEVADVDVGPDGRIYAFTRGRDPIVVFGRDGEVLGSWGHGVFTGPHGITVDGDRVFCTDYLDHTVRVFDTTGRLIQTLGTPGHGSRTGIVLGNRPLEQAAGPFNMPTNVAVAGDGSYYVADGYGNARVHRFTADGTLVHSWGQPGSGPGEFNLPHGIAISRDGSVLVADRENCRIQRFSPEGDYLEEWTGLNRVAAVFVDEEGLVYVAELGFAHYKTPPPHFRFRREPPAGHEPISRISVWTPEGALVTRFGASDPRSPHAFVSPHGLCVDTEGRLFVGEVVVTSGAAATLAPFAPRPLQVLARR